jgi:DNA polymerase-3 subunit delta
MMAERRWVALRHIEHLKEEESSTLVAYLEDPSPQTTLCCTAYKLDGRSRLFKTFSKKGYLVELPPPSQRELPQWLVQRCRELGLTIDVSAAQLLAEVIGSDLEMVERSLELIQNYAHPHTAITTDHVEALICRTKETSVFDLVDALGNRRLAQALSLLRQMEADGQQALMVLGMMARQYRLLLQIKALQAQGLGEGAMAKRLSQAPFVVGKLSGQARQYAHAALVETFPLLLRADIALKSGAGNSFATLEELALIITSKERRASAP